MAKQEHLNQEKPQNFLFSRCGDVKTLEDTWKGFQPKVMTKFEVIDPKLPKWAKIGIPIGCLETCLPT